MLRRACAEGAKRLNMMSGDSSVMVDRRIVIKLLTTFFEKGQSADVLSLMARMLGFTGMSLSWPAMCHLIAASVHSASMTWHASHQPNILSSTHSMCMSKASKCGQHHAPSLPDSKAARPHTVRLFVLPPCVRPRASHSAICPAHEPSVPDPACACDTRSQTSQD